MLLSRASRSFGPQLDKILSYSRPGQSWTTYSCRQRYPVFMKTHTDPVISDYFYARAVKDWCGDVPSYNYWVQMTIGFVLAVMSCSRHMFFNPDVYVRRQEVRKPYIDRVRQWSYSLPFFNHQLRNRAARHRRDYIDNEPDWADHHAAGYRPDRHQLNSRMYTVLSVTRYAEEDPYFTTNSHENMGRIYRDAGYSKI